MWNQCLNIPLKRAVFVYASVFILVGLLLVHRTTTYLVRQKIDTSICINDCDDGLPFLKTSFDETKSISYNPYPDYNSPSWQEKWTGTYKRCTGPDGSLLDFENPRTAMKGFTWNQSESPSPIFGSYEAWKLNRTLCTDHFSRYSAYGYGDKESQIDKTSNGSTVQWNQVNWGQLQEKCLELNAERYQTHLPRRRFLTLHKELYIEDVTMTNSNEDGSLPKHQPRSAVIMRGWYGMEFTEDSILNIRSMIMELSLFSGSEYEIVLLVDVKKKELPLTEDTAGLDEIRNTLPEELRDIAVFFNTQILKDWYPKVPNHEAILQYFQPVQIFSRLNPQYDHIWQFELDSRYTGHYYHLLEQAAEFGKKQPRQNLWERNSYFYIPAIHGTWDDFTDKVDQDMINHKGILDPQPVKEVNAEGKAPIPSADTWNWGVGKEADMITWLPIFDPKDTKWPFRDRIYNFHEKEPLRRTSVVAMSRASRHLLGLMHADQEQKGLGLASEMSPASWALYYGLKAVHVPQPIYHAHKWHPAELNHRSNPGKPGAINAGSDSIWNWDEHNDILLNMTYMFSSSFPGRIYRAWLGYGEEYESGHVCLPPMLLHPVKNTKS